MQVLILAGGIGTRLQPLTLINPKVMIRINGKPFLEYLLLLLKRNGISDIILSIGYLGSQVKNYFNDGAYWGLNIQYSFEQIPLGTGGALMLAKDLLNDEFFFINGDTYLDIDYQEMVRRFRSSNRPMMMAVCKTERSNCIISENGDLREYSRVGLPETYIDAGVWVLRKKLFSLFPDDTKFMVEDHILWGTKQVKVFVSEKRFVDIGTFSGLEKFERYVRRKLL